MSSANSHADTGSEPDPSQPHPIGDPPTTLPSGEPTVAQQRRYRNTPPDPDAPLAVAFAAVLVGIVGLLASFFACAFVLDLIGGIMSISALGTRKTSDSPALVTLVAVIALLLLLADIILLGMRFSNME